MSQGELLLTPGGNVIDAIAQLWHGVPLLFTVQPNIPMVRSHLLASHGSFAFLWVHRCLASQMNLPKEY
jgi:hypothetical protein